VLRSTALYKTKKETVDPVTGEYYVTLPEWVMSEFGWYEGTEVNMEVDGESIVITEVREG
jgi:bifunctional DNA-binding transcriptional regulator/antitoxin component of YhaV-PrlF toxin-antitoxin module